MSCCDSSPVIPEFASPVMFNSHTNSDTESDQDDRYRMVHARKKALEKINQKAVSHHRQVCGQSQAAPSASINRGAGASSSGSGGDGAFSERQESRIISPVQVAPDVTVEEITQSLRGIVSYKQYLYGGHPLVKGTGLKVPIKAYDAVLSALVKHPECVSILEAAMRAWVRFGKNVQGRHGPATKKAIEALIIAVKNHMEHGALVISGVKLLRFLVQKPSKVREMVVRCDASNVPALLVAAMNHHRKNVRVQVAVCDVIFYACDFDTQGFRDAGARKGVLESMRAFPGDHRMQVSGCAAISYLFPIQGDGLESLRDHVDLLLRATRATRQFCREELYEYALCAMGNLAFYGDDDDKIYMVKSGAFDLAVEATTAFPNNEQLQLYGAKTILNLAVEKFQMAEYIKARKVIVASMCRFKNNHQLVQAGCHALSALATACDVDVTNSIDNSEQDWYTQTVRSALQHSSQELKVAGMDLASQVLGFADFRAEVKKIVSSYPDDKDVQKYGEHYLDRCAKVSFSVVHVVHDVSGGLKF
jgi:hypothetical protein